MENSLREKIDVLVGLTALSEEAGPLFTVGIFGIRGLAFALEDLGPAMIFYRRVVLANRQIVGPAVKERGMVYQQSDVDEKCKKEEVGTLAEKFVSVNVITRRGCLKLTVNKDDASRSYGKRAFEMPVRSNISSTSVRNTIEAFSNITPRRGRLHCIYLTILARVARIGYAWHRACFCRCKHSITLIA